MRASDILVLDGANGTVVYYSIVWMVRIILTTSCDELTSYYLLHCMVVGSYLNPLQMQAYYAVWLWTLI